MGGFLFRLRVIVWRLLINLLSRDGECLAAEGVVVEEVKRLMDTACSRCDLCFKDCQYGSS